MLFSGQFFAQNPVDLGTLEKSATCEKRFFMLLTLSDIQQHCSHHYASFLFGCWYVRSFPRFSGHKDALVRIFREFSKILDKSLAAIGSGRISRGKRSNFSATFWQLLQK